MNSHYEKQVLLISNGKSMGSKPNTLTRFSCEIPSNFLKSHKEWKVGLNSYGIHMNLKQKLCSKNDAMPAIIQISYKDFQEQSDKHPNATNSNIPLNMFQRRHMIFISDDQSYTATSLAKHIANKIQKQQLRTKSDWCGYPVKSKFGNIYIGQFDGEGTFDTSEKRELETIVFLNKYFYKYLNLSKKEKLKTTRVDGELYYFFFNSSHLKSKSYYPFKAKETKFFLEKPKIIHVVSSQIGNTIYNDKYQQCLKQFTVSSNEVGKYVQHEFDELEFSSVLNKTIDNFDVTFLDQNFKKLRIRQGLPSFVKLIFSSVMKREVNVHVSSESNDLYANNDIANFNIVLPKTLDFSWTKNPKVALTSVSFKNKWKIMPGLSLDFSVVDFVKDTFRRKGVDPYKTGPRSCEDICKHFERQANRRTEVVRAKKQLDGTYTITFITNGILILGRDLSQILGFRFADKLGHNTCMKIDKDNNITTNFFYEETNVKEDMELKKKIYENINRHLYSLNLKEKLEDPVDIKSFFARGEVVLCGEKGANFDLQYLPRTIELFPNNIFIYTNFVVGSAVLGEYKKLLRIIHLPNDKKDQHITLDFPRLDFHNLSELKLNLLQFKIVTADGRDVEPFDNDETEHMYMNLMFVHDI